MSVLKVIIVALDCSEISEQVMGALDALFLQPQTKLIFAHVLPPPTSDGDLAADRPHQSAAALYQAIEKQLQAYQARQPNSEIEIVSGDTTEEIVRLANIYHADLIVIGTRGLKGVERVIEGSVSSQVAADAPCSVLVVKG
jgi:nucleotide-binding universal stress UspA family protein